MTVKVEKPTSERISECMAILKKLVDEVGIDAQNPSIRVLKKRMAQYWRDGKLQEDKLPLWGYDRSILYKFPRWSHQIVEVTLRVNAIAPQLPPDLEEELQRPMHSQSTNQPHLSDPVATPPNGMSSAMQSDPSHPSPPVSAEK